jgi:hypothetical protein
LCALALVFVPSLASADEPSPVVKAQRRVEDGLVKPLAERVVSKFSRSRPAPRERRARVTQAVPSRDKSGRAFMTFAVDVRFGEQWRENDITGCVYTASGELFVKSGDAYRPAAFLLGKNVEPVAGVCETAPARA